MTGTSTAPAVVLLVVLAGGVAIAGALLGRFVLGLLLGALLGLALATTAPGAWITEHTAPAITSIREHATSWKEDLPHD